MKWYCEHLNGRHSELAKKCEFLDKDVSDGAVLATNGGKVGAWYFGDDIDTRPTTVCGWKTIEAHACNCKCENECPVAIARSREIDEFVQSVIEQGEWHAFHVWSELNRYIMTKNNPMGAIYPQDVQLPREYAYEAADRLHSLLTGGTDGGTITNNNRQPA